jgi:uracil-DNA glycosylase
MPLRFEALQDQMRGCTLCKGLPLGPRPIFQINPKAKILIVGQAPGRITHHKSRPFDDPSGERLRDWLGIDKYMFYTDRRVGILPMGFCFPGTGKSGDLAPRPECAPAWREKALAHMPDVELTVVMGRYAINWHLPKFSKLSVRDAVKAAANSDQSAFVLPHPSPRNNRWLSQNPWFEQQVIPKLRSRIRALLDLA